MTTTKTKYESAMEEYKAARAELERMRKAAVSVCANAFKEVLQETFDKHPWVESVSFTQYTPYFNDGDECTFSVHAYYDALYINSESFYDAGYRYDPKNRTMSKETEQAYKDFSKVIESFADEDMKEMFGDHVKVTITRSGINVEGYSHE